MKKFVSIGIIFSVLMVLCPSCENTNNKSSMFSNSEQAAFDKFLSEKNSRRYSQKNDIQEKEYLDQFEQDLFNYVDSVGLFVNWKGRIKDISTSNTGKHSTSIDFRVYYEPEQYRKVEFRCLYVVDNDSLKNDHIYNVVKNISNYSTVYFDGFIRTTNKNTVKYNYHSPGDDLNIPYPTYDFFIIDIGEVNRGDTLSPNLQSAIDYAYKINKVVKQHILKQISDEEMHNQLETINPDFTAVKSELTTEEVAYLDRLTNAMTMNVIYGD
jgi:hypothetical protein